MDFAALAESINAVDFDHPFRIVAGEIEDVSDAYAPNVWNSDTNDVDVESTEYGRTWETIRGFTQQYSYRGSVMHSSEQIGAAIAEHLVTMGDDHVFAVVAVTDPDNLESLVGWTIAYRTV